MDIYISSMPTQTHAICTRVCVRVTEAWASSAMFILSWQYVYVMYVETRKVDKYSAWIKGMRI